MSELPLKQRIQQALWSVVEGRPEILSATLTGSFQEADTLDAVSDIDFVVVLDCLDESRYRQLLAELETALTPVLSRAGFGLYINPTLGPLKFNDPRTAVLHLMLYSRAGHVEHVVSSPFTCLDWQRSKLFCQRSLAQVYPVFGLQPHHFVSSRRSVTDYLRDYDARVVSYRELVFSVDGPREEKRTKLMDVRDRYEFSYHIVRFLMENLVKLVTRRNLALRGDALLDAYFAVFPENRSAIAGLYRELARKKQRADFTDSLPNLDVQLRDFISRFEAQFQDTFVQQATRHVVFRHAETAANRGKYGNRVFLGRSNPPIENVPAERLERLASTIGGHSIERVFCSPLLRCLQSLQQVTARCSLPTLTFDDRLLEIDYGAVEGLTIDDARRHYPELFHAWDRHEDPCFPDGESTQAVERRVVKFVNECWGGAGNTLTCTHNVVLRALVGRTLQVPPELWHKIQIPHLAPIVFVQTREHGLFLDLSEDVEREVFREFAERAPENTTAPTLAAAGATGIELAPSLR
ncbi:MAG: histidine phosphatase family protein [Planctomycetes bacterium]|nr:histidine phosphatase family protein [Planctomycetota bacterium]